MAEGIGIAEVLALPELLAGEPEVVAGAQGLGREARWAHVVAGVEGVQLLDGGELVLTTGTGWSRDAAALTALARALVAADPAAVVLELGRNFREAPAPLVSACESGGIPLIVLRREVRFVQLTQRIHQRVLADQSEALAARAEVHAMLTELGLNRSPVDYVIERLADTLAAPVVLEDSAGRVVAWSDSGAAGPAGAAAPQDRGRIAGDGAGGSAPESVVPRKAAAAHALAEWAEGPPAALPAGSEQVPVEAQGRRWGRLTALPGPAHPAGRRTVLELGAFALALGRLADPEGEQWLQLSSKRVFDMLLGGRYRRAEELAVQLAASGLPVRDRALLGATLQGIGDFAPGGGHEGPLEQALLQTALRRAVSPDGRVLLAPDRAAEPPTLLALLSFPAGDPRASDPAAFAARLNRELGMLLPATTPAAWRAHLALGPAGTRVRALITSLEQVRAAGTLDPVAETGRVTVQQAERQPLAYLVRGLSGTPEVQDFAADALGPLLAHDAASGPGHSGDLVEVLRAYLAHPTNRSLAAQRARLSRSVFYQRLALIEELLDVDLADGTVIATLAVALLARR
ncbi:PucR family transcriptional regulator [Leucobacter massiliensis]|uniref:PucR family transcriptional regulator n=1 Tax=Leucobacter massiliensis TaxID=1686285 RepID=A0A2S9QSQ0_9MICO|nr:PucR family transcriptional regulator [Leucobacter massiliensis]